VIVTRRCPPPPLYIAVTAEVEEVEEIEEVDT
jgi:hypothetical protein